MTKFIPNFHFCIFYARDSYFALKILPNYYFRRANIHIEELSMTWTNSICIIFRHFRDWILNMLYIAGISAS